MKKLLITLLALNSISAFANQYEKIVFDCKISASSTSISTAYNQGLPKEIDFKVIITSLEGKNKVLRTELTTDLLSISEVRKVAKAWSVESVLAGSDLGASYRLSFDSLDPQKTRDLLIELGDTNIPVLGSGFKPRTLRMKQDVYHSGYQDEIVNQIHTKEGQDGEAYHLSLLCYEMAKPIRRI